MKNLLIYTLMMLLLKKYVMSEEPCSEKNITGAVGGAITLQVGHTGVITIIWIFREKGGAIATTTPEKPPVTVENQYKGRLNSTADGSLIITELKQEDQGIYRAQIITQNGTLDCYYHLTVFSNLTDKDIIINSNVIDDNNTCEGNLTCSVNSTVGSKVTITWSANSNIITRTQNVVFVPSSSINFIYICTAENPVSKILKYVVPRVYCNNKSEGKNDVSNRGSTIILNTIIFFVVVVAFIGIAWFVRKRKKKFVDVSKNAGSETPNVEQSTPSRERGTAGMSNDPQAIELQQSKSNETTGNTLYSTVQHVKQKNNNTKQPCPSNGKPSKAPPKPPHKVLEPPKGKIDQVESCYAEVQLPKDKSDQKSPSKGLNGDHSMAPMESCYAQVQLPKNCETQYGQVQGMGSKSSNE